jgi:hypothetical protein|tara:strand:+ start:428 stop:586 length:159 start_codon:yes stop_codon:yes gene_type:complete
VLEQLFIQAQELFREQSYQGGYKSVEKLMSRALLPYQKETSFGKAIKELRLK